MLGFIYKWTRRTTGEYYIGQHIGSPDDGYIGSGVMFRRKFNSTKEEWDREIICYCSSRRELNRMEAYAISNCYELDKLCLNAKAGGDVNTYPHCSRLFGSKNPMFGKTHSKEARAKLSEASRNRVWSDKSRQKLRDSKLGVKRAPFSQECLDNMSKARRAHDTKPMLGKKHSAETKKKMSESSQRLSGKDHPMWGKPGSMGMLGKKHSNKAKETMRANSGSAKAKGPNHWNAGKKWTIQTRLKIKMSKAKSVIDTIK